MTFFDAIIFGVVEGITEFLPISSTGHLILTGKFLNLVETDFLTSFQIAIQLGAILAIVFLYWRKLLVDRGLVARVLAAFVPTAIIGLALYSFAKKYLLGSATVVLVSLLVGGIVLILFEWWYSRRPERHIEIDVVNNVDNSLSQVITYKQAIMIGIVQSLAIVPGVSRAGATVVGGLALGLPRKTIVEFSFLLAIPTMAAATGLDLLKTGTTFSVEEWMLLATGFIVSAVVALVVVKWLLRFITHNTFTVFGWYRVLIAIVGLYWFM